jgi:hypothetical protein
VNKKTIGIGLIVVGGLLAAAAVANMNADKLPVSVTSKIPVLPTGRNVYNAGIGLAVLAAGYWLQR